MGEMNPCIIKTLAAGPAEHRCKITFFLRFRNSCFSFFAYRGRHIPFFRKSFAAYRIDTFPDRKTTLIP